MWQVIATTSTAEKAALGGVKVVNYTETPDRDVKVRELTDGLRRFETSGGSRLGRRHPPKATEGMQAPRLKTFPA